MASLKVLFLTQWFEPEPVMKGSAFAKAIADRGHQVEVATGFPNYPGGKLYPGYRVRLYQSEMIDGIRVHRLPLYPSHDHSSWRRALNYLSFMVSALLFCLFRGGRYDIIYVYHPPLTVGFAAALTGMITRTPFVIDVQDLWPDSVVSSGMAHTGRLASILGAACRFIYRRAAMVVAQSNGMREEIARREVEAKVVTIFNWADEASFAHPQPVPDAIGLADHFTFLYA
ncbi:MAG: glycosyltransferase WbuB, partial [Hyphomicrobiales bacterium]